MSVYELNGDRVVKVPRKGIGVLTRFFKAIGTRVSKKAMLKELEKVNDTITNLNNLKVQVETKLQNTLSSKSEIRLEKGLEKIEKELAKLAKEQEVLEARLAKRTKYETENISLGDLSSEAIANYDKDYVQKQEEETKAIEALTEDVTTVLKESEQETTVLPVEPEEKAKETVKAPAPQRVEPVVRTVPKEIIANEVTTEEFTLKGNKTSLEDDKIFGPSYRQTQESRKSLQDLIREFTTQFDEILNTTENTLESAKADMDAFKNETAKNQAASIAEYSQKETRHKQTIKELRQNGKKQEDMIAVLSSLQDLVEKNLSKLTKQGINPPLIQEIMDKITEVHEQIEKLNAKEETKEEETTKEEVLQAPKEEIKEVKALPPASEEVKEVEAALEEPKQEEPETKAEEKVGLSFDELYAEELKKKLEDPTLTETSRNFFQEEYNKLIGKEDVQVTKENEVKEERPEGKHFETSKEVASEDEVIKQSESSTTNENISNEEKENQEKLEGKHFASNDIFNAKPEFDPMKDWNISHDNQEEKSEDTKEAEMATPEKQSVAEEATSYLDNEIQKINDLLDTEKDPQTRAEMQEDLEKLKQERGTTQETIATNDRMTALNERKQEITEALASEKDENARAKLLSDLEQVQQEMAGTTDDFDALDDILENSKQK